MLSIFLFFVLFSIYIWLDYDPHRTSNQHHHSVTARVPDTFGQALASAKRPDEDNPTVQISDNRIPIAEQPASIAATEQLTTDMELATQCLPKLIRPNPPAPSLIEAARESTTPQGDTVANDAAQIPDKGLAPKVKLDPPESALHKQMPSTNRVEEPKRVGYKKTRQNGQPSKTTIHDAPQTTQHMAVHFVREKSRGIGAVAEPETGPVSEALAFEEKDVISPVLTEKEANAPFSRPANALVVKTTLADDAIPEAFSGEQEGSVPKPIHPNPPNPSLIEVAVYLL